MTADGISLPPKRVKRQREASNRDQIREAIIRLGYAAVWPNDQGLATYYSETSDYHVRYGMGEGSPDLVGMVTIEGVGVFLGIEVKNPGRDTTKPHRRKLQEQWRERIERMGGIHIRATSPEDALTQLDERVRSWRKTT